MNRRKIIAGNWKLNLATKEAKGLAESLKKSLSGVSDVDIIICPVFTVLQKVAEVISGSNIQLGAQTLFWENVGAFTGEVSAEMLVDAGCSYVIIGHSERRQYFGETDASVNKKLVSALKAGLTPIVCIGETLEQREKNIQEDAVGKQVREGFAGISEADMKKTVIAYEPVWAIGTGKNASPSDADTMHGFIRRTIAGLFSFATADYARIQYGGSVKPDNIDELMALENVDGALVGGAALKADLFTRIVNFKR